MDMDMLSTLPRHLNTKDLSNEANALNVTMPAAAAAAFQLSTNFLNAVSIITNFTCAFLQIYTNNQFQTKHLVATRICLFGREK